MMASIEKFLMRGSVSALALGCALALGACSDDDGDDGSKADTGTPVADSGTDASKGSLDASVDATSPAVDSSAAVEDAKVADSGHDAAVDASAAVIPTLNGCTPEMYVDNSASSATRTVVFGGSTGLAYAPKCMIIAAGQKVTFNGSFTAHPLAKGNSADPNAGSADSPIVDVSSGDSKEITFPTAGTYPYYCTVHKPNMAGSIHVK
jgi:plastocyanin